MKLELPDARLIAGRGLVVTGAASGIGRALSCHFASDGAVVVGVDRNAVGLTELEPEGIRPLVGDVTNPSVLDEAAAMVAREVGHVDVLVNNAGFGLRRAIEELEVGEFEQVYAVHVLGSLYGIRSVAPYMRRQGFGRIINVLSRAAEACQPKNVAYSSAKAALWAVSRTAANELASGGILVNCLIPGMTNTGIWGRPRPELQDPERVYPTALALATLPEGGPTGRIFWDLTEYDLFARTIGTGCEAAN